MFFEGWQGLLRVVIAGLLAYVGLIVFLRFFGKRSLSKWNAFDFVVTVALGSILGTVVVSKQLPLAEGVFAFFWLLALQYMVTWLSIRSSFFENMVKSEPTLLFYRGEFIKKAMREQRVPKEEILSAIRSSGTGLLEKVEAVVLETNGNFSVIEKSDEEGDSALSNIENYDSDEEKPE